MNKIKKCQCGRKMKRWYLRTYKEGIIPTGWICFNCQILHLDENGFDYKFRKIENKEEIFFEINNISEENDQANKEKEQKNLRETLIAQNKKKEKDFLIALRNDKISS